MISTGDQRAKQNKTKETKTKKEIKKKKTCSDFDN